MGARSPERRAGRGELPAAERTVRRLVRPGRARPGRGVVPRHGRRHQDVRRRCQQALPAVGHDLERRVAHGGRGLCTGRRQSLALHPVRHAGRRRERRRPAAEVRPGVGHQLDGAGGFAAGRHLHRDGPRLRPDGQDRQHAAARAVVGHQQCRPVGQHRDQPGRFPGRCPTAATSPAWSAASTA